MTPSLLFWLAAAVALLAAEGLTVNLVSIWFAVGAVGGLAASWLGASLLVQFAVFALVSFVCLLVTRPLVRRLQHAALPAVAANASVSVVAFLPNRLTNAGKPCLSPHTSRSSGFHLLSQPITVLSGSVSMPCSLQSCTIRLISRPICNVL